MSKRPKAALYAAVSIDERKKGRRTEYDSVESQLDELRQAAREQGYLFDHDSEFFDRDDSGLTGRGDARARMFERAAAGEFDVIMAARMDRISRNAEEQLYLIPRMMDRWGVELVLIDDVWDLSSPTTRLTTGIRALVNQYKSEDSREKTKRKFHTRVTLQGLHNGPPPFGYTKSDGNLHIQPQQAETVRRIYAWFLESGSIAYVKDQAFQAGLMKRGQSHQHAGELVHITDHAIEHIIQSRVYIGEVTYKGDWFQGIQETIIDQEVFEAAQRIMAETKQIRSKGDRYDALIYPLQGLVWCGETRICEADGSLKWDFEYMGASCVKKGTGAGSKAFQYYRRWSNEDKKRRGSMVEVIGEQPDFSSRNAKALENDVVEYIARIAEDDERWEDIDDTAKAIMVAARAGIAKLKIEREQERRQTEMKLQELDRYISSLSITKDVERVIKRINQQLVDLETRLAEIEQAIQYCDELDTWYVSVPDIVRAARMGYLRAAEYSREGRRRPLQTALRNILAPPYGVLIFNDRIEVKLRLSAKIDDLAKKYSKLEVYCRNPPYTHNLFAQCVKKLAA